MVDIPRHLHDTIKIAVCGAAETSACGDKALDLTRELGHEIIRQGAMLINGATSGIPLWAARGAKEEGGFVIGISPAKDEREHVEHYKLPIDYCDLILYAGDGYPGRDILLTQTADGIIFGCGRIGTFHEFSVAFEEKKPMGILRGEYMTDDIMLEIIKYSNRAADNPYVIVEENPKVMVEKMMAMVKKLKEVD